MDGTGVPLATPFDDRGRIREDDLRRLATWVTDRGVDFVVPCGSNGEAALLDVDERTRVIETVADAVDVPVLAGTGHPGLAVTRRQTERAAAAGADAALVVTPYYHSHDDATLAAYYRDLADASPLPVYLYSVPAYTGTTLDPRTVESVATHVNVAGIKDSSGDYEVLVRYLDRTGEDFSVLVGGGSLYATGLDAGADGGVLALANVVPETTAEIYRRHREGDAAGARRLNRRLVDLNRAITAEYGVPGMKAAVRARDQPAGRPRRPFQPLDDAATTEVERLVADALSSR